MNKEQIDKKLSKLKVLLDCVGWLISDASSLASEEEKITKDFNSELELSKIKYILTSAFDRTTDAWENIDEIREDLHKLFDEEEIATNKEQGKAVAKNNRHAQKF